MIMIDQALADRDGGGNRLFSIAANGHENGRMAPAIRVVRKAQDLAPVMLVLVPSICNRSDLTRRGWILGTSPLLSGLNLRPLEGHLDLVSGFVWWR
ncbi:hypothetical protein OLP54_09100, partial [Agrobacterium sp. MAFF310724]